MKKIKVGQIGIGHNHGYEKLLAVRKFPELFEVIGFAEENPEWIEKRGNMEAYRDLPRLTVQEVIEKSDAVLIESDVWDLNKYARMCVDAGKHIHLDKPAGDLLEYKEILETAESSGLVVQLGYMYRYNPAIKKCIELVKEGALGEIYSINAEMSTFHSKEYRGWLKNFGGGIMYILGSHLIDLVVYMLGKPEKVVSFLKHSGLDNVEADDNNLAVLEYEKALARVFVSSVEVNGWGRRQLVVTGSKGSINICPIENPTIATYSDLSIADFCYADKKVPLEYQSDSTLGRYDEMVKDFYDYIIGKKENPFTYEHEYAVQDVLDKVVGGVNMYGNNIN